MKKTIEGFRLSPQQKHLWLLQSAEKSVPYRVVGLVLIEGKLKAEVFKAALQNVVKKYEILRTTFHDIPESNLPVQVINNSSRIPIKESDLRGLSPRIQEEKIETLFQEAKQMPFDFEGGPLLNLIQVILSPERQMLRVCLPALCADGVSLENLVGEISHSYHLCTQNEEFSKDPMQYVDLSEWQHELLEAEETKIGREYWRAQDFTALSTLTLPFENQGAGKSPLGGFEPQCLNWTIDSDIVAKVKAFVHESNTSTRVFLLTCWFVTLRRLMGQSELIVGVGDDGRKYEELKEPLGLLAQYLPLQCHLEDGASFMEILEQVHQATDTIEKWQACFSWEQMAGQRSGEKGEASFFPFCFDFEKPLRWGGGPTPAPPGEGTLDPMKRGLKVSIQKQYVLIDRFKIKLSCLETADSLITTFHYDSNGFGVGAINRLAGQFQTVLESAVNHPQTAICHLDILSEVEKRKLLVEFNDTQTDYPITCIHQQIEEQAQRTPDAIAVVFEEQQLSYATLNARANQLARHLQALGVGPNVLVGICVERSPEMIIGILGILKAGGAYVPLDPTYPKERLSFMLEETRAKVLLTQANWVDALPPHKALTLCLDTDWESIPKESEDNPQSGVTPDNLVYVIYTSGSTGKPKGVVVTHQKLVISNGARIAYFNEHPDQFLLLSSFAFDSSVVGIFWTLCQGGTLLLIREESQQNLSRLTELIAENRVSHLLTLPSFYALILEHMAPHQLDCLRTVIVAGEPCPKKMVDHHKELLKSTGLFSEYGATETTVFSSVYNCLDQRLPIAPVGDPIANAQMYLLDSHLSPVPIGVPGEVHFGGDALALGYLNRPDLTAERFIPHPFSEVPGARLYKSGDLARHLENGDIEFLGRIDHQVKIRGFRIELEEIEVALGQHPSIREAVVMAREDSDGYDRSIGGKRLVAYLVVRGSTAPSVKELRSFLLELLPEFMVPSAFVFLSDLPRTPNGKVDRHALPKPGPDRPELEESFVAPRTPTEKVLAEIWAGVLGLEGVGVHDNFFELGGDSILSIQIISRANQAGLKLTPRQLFQHQTIAELATVASTIPTQVIASKQEQVVGPVPLTPVQHWFFELNLPDPHHWNMPMLLEVRGALSPSRLKQVVRELLVHHDALRLRFFQTESGWEGKIATFDEVAPFDWVDLSSLKEAEQKAAIAQKAAEFQASLNLKAGPLMRVVFFDLGAHKPSRLLWIIHHLAVDGVSWRILLEDLQTALAQLNRGQAIQLPPKTTSFKEWAWRLKEYAQSGGLHEEVDSWLSLEKTRISPLPLNFPGGANTEESARKVSVSLTVDETSALLTEVPKAYNTQINDVLLTALVQAFTNWTGNPSLFINLEGHGREEILEGMDLSRTVGWFTTDFPVLLEVNAPFEPGEALKAIKEQLRSIPNQGIGYGVLRYLSEDAEMIENLRRLPKPSVGFNYLGQFDPVFKNTSLFQLARESSGPDKCPRGNRAFLLEVYGWVSNGQLEMDWEYSSNLYKRSTIEGLAQGFITTLRTLIVHCLSPEAGDYTPSDFAEFQWGQTDLDNITAAIKSVMGHT